MRVHFVQLDDAHFVLVRHERAENGHFDGLAAVAIAIVTYLHIRLLVVGNAGDPVEVVAAALELEAAVVLGRGDAKVIFWYAKGRQNHCAQGQVLVWSWPSGPGGLGSGPSPLTTSGGQCQPLFC